MRRVWTGLIAAASIFLLVNAALRGGTAEARRQSTGFTPDPGRLSPADLEIGGDLAGLPPASTLYLTYDDLHALPQVHYTVTDDANFTGAVEVSGVALEELVQRLGAAPKSELVTAICNDR